MAPLLYLVRLLVPLLELLVVLLTDVGGFALDVEAGGLRLGDVDGSHRVVLAVPDRALLALVDPAQCYQVIPAPPPL